MNGVYKEYFKVTDKEVLGFFEDYRFLSNFHVDSVEYEGDMYPSSEHAYQAAKYSDRKCRIPFMDVNLTCSQARKLGQIPNEFYDLDWNDHRYDVMYKVVMDKFTRHEYLKNKLLDTGDMYLEETNHWGDRYWGVDFRTGIGENSLGKILMEVRNQLKK